MLRQAQNRERVAVGHEKDGAFVIAADGDDSDDEIVINLSPTSS